MRHAFLLLLIGAAAATGFSSVYEFNTTLEPVDQIIRIEGDLVFSKLIPGQEYGRNFTVHWAVPKESLLDLQQDRVNIHVLAFAPEGSWIRFRKNDRIYKAYAFDLSCHREGSGCLPDSQLNQTVQLTLLVPANATVRPESVRFNASLTSTFRSELESADFLAILKESAENFQSVLLPGVEKTVRAIPSSVPTLDLFPKTPSSSPVNTQATATPAGSSLEPNASPTPVLESKKTSLETENVAQEQTVQSSSRRSTAALDATSDQTKEVGPFTGFIPREFKDVAFVVGILAILGLLLLLGKTFPEKPQGLG